MNIDLSKSYVIGLLAFLWSLTLGLLLQLFVLPYIFPDLHAGNGLLKGADWVWFNEIAVELAQKINETGWDNWELRPYGQAPAGLAAAMYSLSGISKPFMYMPLNATLFAIAIAEMHRFISYATKENKYTWVGVLPILVFPSSLLIYGQLHKDMFSIAGIFLIFNTLLLTSNQKGWGAYLSFFVRTILGLYLIWIVRPYFMEVVSIAWFAGMSILVLWILWRRPLQFIRLLIIVIGMLCIHQWSVSISSTQDYFVPPPKVFPIDSNLIDSNLIDSNLIDSNLIDSNLIDSNLTDSNLIDSNLTDSNLTDSNLTDSNLIDSISNLINSNVLVNLLTRKFDELTGTFPARFDRVRRNFINGYPNAGSMIDLNVRFYSISDLINYAPRAIQIGYLAPFPSMWTVQGVNPGSGIMRKISGIEMLIAYVTFMAGIVGLIIKRKSEYFVIIMSVLLVSAVIMVVQSTAIPNVGTLYRMRLAPWHMTLGLSFYFAFKAFVLPRINKNL